MKISLHKTINPSIPLTALWMAGCLFLWFLPIKTSSENIENQSFLPLAQLLQTILPASAIVTKIVCIALAALSGVLLNHLNNIFALVKEKTFIVFLTFIILISTFYSTHYNVIAYISLIFLFLSFFNFLKMYRNVQQTEAAFLGSFLIACIGWLFLPEFLLLFIPLWLGIVQLRAMSLKVFLATLIGLVTPAIFCFVYDQNYFIFFISHFENIGIKWLFFGENSVGFPSFFFAIMLIIWGLSLYGIYSNSLLNNVRARTNLNFLLIFFISIIIITIIFPQAFYAFLPALSALFAVFFAHPITLRNSTLYKIIFIIFCFVNLIYVLYNLIFSYL